MVEALASINEEHYLTRLERPSTSSISVTRDRPPPVGRNGVDICCNAVPPFITVARGCSICLEAHPIARAVTETDNVNHLATILNDCTGTSKEKSARFQAIQEIIRERRTNRAHSRHDRITDLRQRQKSSKHLLVKAHSYIFPSPLHGCPTSFVINHYSSKTTLSIRNRTAIPANQPLPAKLQPSKTDIIQRSATLGSCIPTRRRRCAMLVVIPREVSVVAEFPAGC